MNTKTAMKTKTKVLIGAGVYLAIVILLLLIFGNDGKNEEFQPQNEFKLHSWVSIHLGPIDLSINRAVFYLLLTSGLTIGAMCWIAKKMQQRPNKTQAAVEMAYDLAKKNITRGNIESAEVATRWFPFIGALFFFLLFANIIGYLPLPTNTGEHFNVFGLEIPTFAIYAATANISIPIVLTLVVWISYHVEGVRAKGFIPYMKSWLPPGLENMSAIGRGAIFAIEIVSHFVRLVSLSVRLFANMLAGHLLLLFMGGGLAVLLGIAALGALTFPLAFAFFVFELGLVATLQAFIFATLSAIYIGGATSANH